MRFAGGWRSPHLKMVGGGFHLHTRKHHCNMCYMCMCGLYNTRACVCSRKRRSRKALHVGSSASVLVVQLCACEACVCILSLQIHATLESALISVLRTRARGYFPRSLPQDMGADAPTRFHPSPSPDWPTPRRGSRDSRRLGAASPHARLLSERFLYVQITLSSL